jgi:magnesium-transporting ATPase (P-type)
MGDLSSDAALKRSASARRGVPKKYLETPNRIWLKRMIRVMGLFFFTMTVMTIATIFLGMLFPVIGNEEVGNVILSMIVGLFFVNHMGLMIEMGGDSAGKNWFAKGAALMWLFLFGTFLIAVMLEIFTCLF